MNRLAPSPASTLDTIRPTAVDQVGSVPPECLGDPLAPGRAETSETIVCKFGGSSVADARQIEKVAAIVAADRRRRIVVVSAPGRSGTDDEKITDHLLNVATDGERFADRRPAIGAVESRAAVLDKFASIVHGLGLDLEDLLDAIDHDFDTELEGALRTSFLASRGEHYNARIVAAYLAHIGVPTVLGLPEEIGLRVRGNVLDARVGRGTDVRLSALAGRAEVTVIPGFYGVNDAGDIAVFSRGGSDLTGGEVASALGAAVYENWTDVSGVLEADPTVIPDARAIPRLTFKEIRLLSSKGFNVFHFDAMLNCRRTGVPIHIRNTNRPDDPGTRILQERVPEEGVVGIARLDDVAYIYLEKDALSDELGFTASLLAIFQRFGINTIHYPTDKDDIAVLVQQDDLKGSINDLRRSIVAELAPDSMEVGYNLAVLTPVGLGLKGNSQPVVRAITALAEAHIPIEMFHQSPSQLCFHIGVSQAVADDASRILYEALIAGDP